MNYANRFSFSLVVGSLLATTPSCADRGLGGSESGTDSTTYDPKTMTCEDSRGVQHQEGETFESEDGCALFQCTTEGIQVIQEEPSVLPGDLTVIEGTDLEGLECIREVTGNLRIGTELEPGLQTTLTPLSGLQRVGGSLVVQNNPGLTTLAGLGGIVNVGNELVIHTNPALVETAALNPQLVVFGAIRVIDNDAITDVAGLAFLGTCNGCGHVDPVPGLALGADREPQGASAGFTGGDDPSGGSVGQTYGDLEIRGNENLFDLTSLQGLSWVQGGLVLNENPSVVDLGGFGVLTSVTGDFSIQSNLALAEVLAQDLLAQTAVTGMVVICGNLNGVACP